MIQDDINTIADAAAAITEKSLKITPEKQYADIYKDQFTLRAFACWFTVFHMYFKYRFSLAFSLSWESFKIACVKTGGMNEGFAILDESGSVSKIAKAAGQNLTRYDTNKNIAEKCFELLNLNQPIPFSLNGEHYELITGKKEVLGKLCFEVNDPGWQNDEYADCLTLEVFRIENGIQKFSIGHDGKRRKITRIYWFE